MGKSTKIALIASISIIVLIYAAFLFAVPAVVNLNKFKPEIKKAIKDSSGLDFDAKNLKFNTYWDFSAGLTVNNAEINANTGNPLLKVNNARIKVHLLPLIQQKIQIEELSIDKPEIFLTRLKDGKYDIERIIEKTSSQPVEQAARRDSPSKPAAPVFEPVFNGIDVVISNYAVNLKDLSATTPRNFLLKGDILKVEDLNLKKYAKLIAKGALYIENNPKINYDIAIATDIPPVGEIKNQAQPVSGGPEKQISHTTTKIDPIEKLIKYDLKGDITADLRLKNRGAIPEIDGTFGFDKLSFKVGGKKLPDSYGKFKFSGKKIVVDSKLFITPAAYIQASGKINNFAKQDFDINVKTTEILLSDVKKFAYTLADAFNVDVRALNDINLAGRLNADFDLKKDDYSGYLNILNANISHKDISKPLSNFNSRLKFDKNKIIMEKTAGSVGDIAFNAGGSIASDLKTDLKIEIPAINLPTVVSIVNNSRMFAGLRPQIKDYKKISGTLKAVATLKGRLDKKINPEISLTFDKASAYIASAGLPVAVTRGKILADEKRAELKDIKLVVSYSPVNISGQITDLAGDIDIDATAEGVISAADIKEYLPPDAGRNVKIDKLPLLAKITGKARDLDVIAQANIDNLSTIVKFNQPAGVSNIFHINANIKPTIVSIEDTGLFAGSNLTKDRSGLYNLSSSSRLIGAKGLISNINTADPYLNDIKVDVSGLNLSITEPEGKLQLNGNLLVIGKSSAPKAYGNINIRNIDIPSMYIKADSVDVALKEEEISVNTTIVNILDSKIQLAAALENKLSPPYIVKSVKVNSDFMNIDKLSQAFASQPVSRKASGQRHSTGQPSGVRPQPRDVPVIIHNGVFSAKKFVASNLLNNDMSFNFTIKPLNKLQIRNFITHTGGGTGTGIIDMNLKSSKLLLDMEADNIEINALATTLAKLPNEIFGKMRGRIKLTTIGQTPEAMTQNAVGRTDFYIENGHLPRLANLQYLLGANNLSIKGLTDSLFSNSQISDQAAATNQFDSLEGLVMINRGSLDVQEIKMKGQYMSSFISGTVRMGSNHANLTVLSTLSGRIVKNLGDITEISVDNLIRKIPGEWGQLLANQRLANQYPNRDKIPSLNNEPLPQDRDFAVKINGVIGQPSSVSMFEWLPQTPEQAQQGY